ncbi:MAG: lipoprotein-releasing system permease protein [Candidatus Azotimanducaceae bacterium]
MNLPFFIGLRFSTKARGSNYLSFITKASMFGFSLGVMALVIVVSVMNGFDSQLKGRILGAVPHMVVDGELSDSLKNSEFIAATSIFQQREGILVQGSVNRMVAIYGIEPKLEPKVSVIPQNMKIGSIEDLAGNKIIIGEPLARRLGLWIGDSITILIPEASKKGNSIAPKIASVIVAGTFELHSELDYSLVLMNVDYLRTITGDLSIQNRLSLDDVFHVEKVRNLAGEGVEIQDWSEVYGDFFETVKMEKLMMFILLTFIVMIAAFNTISGLSMMVKDKQSEIAVLRTMGLSRISVMQIFVVQGSFIGLLGIIFGLALGIPLAFHITEIVGFVEDLLGNRMLAGTYFDRVPSDVRLSDILVIVALSLFISIVATLFPAYRASKVEPASILRGL